MFTDAEDVLFSQLAFASHDSSYSLFQVGEEASFGVQSVAE
ncbi:MAG: hypothetical protein QNJ64_17965 [Crocosphaera sp.]|nr:hypothetical protein [Crocosphaera sp.]